MVVELYHSCSKVKDLTSKYSVSYVTIYKWIKNILLFIQKMVKLIFKENNYDFSKEVKKTKKKIT